jgi:hypothetical protein
LGPLEARSSAGVFIVLSVFKNSVKGDGSSDIVAETSVATTLAAVDCLSDRYIRKVHKSTILDNCIVSEHCQDKQTIMVGFNDQSSPRLLLYDCSCALHVALEDFGTVTFLSMEYQQPLPPDIETTLCTYMLSRRCRHSGD